MHKLPIARVADLLLPWLDEMQRKADHPAISPGPVSGLRDLDRVLLGFGAGELTIIGGRPAMGKTSMVVNFATHVGVDLLPVVRNLVYREDSLNIRSEAWSVRTRDL